MSTTKQHIIQKAFALFMTTGYAEVSMSMLLKATGLSKGGFYHHFESKEQLFEEVVDQFFFGVASDVQFNPSPAKSFLENIDDFLGQKEAAFTMFAAYLGVEHSELNFFLFIMQAIRFVPGVRQKVDLFIYREKQQLEKILELAAANGELKPGVEPRKIAEMFMLLFDGIEMHGVILSQSFETPRKERDMARLVYDSIKRQ